MISFYIFSTSFFVVEYFVIVFRIENALNIKLPYKNIEREREESFVIKYDDGKFRNIMVYKERLLILYRNVGKK